MPTKRTSVAERGQLLRLDQPEDIQESGNQDGQRSRKQEKKKVAPMIKANLLVRREQWSLLKRYAVEHDRKYYEVLDEALARFLESKASQ